MYIDKMMIEIVIAILQVHTTGEDGRLCHGLLISGSHRDAGVAS